jgi:hypothetical protein
MNTRHPRRKSCPILERRFGVLSIRILTIVTAGMLVPVVSWSGTPIPLPPADTGQTNILDGEVLPGAMFEVIGYGTGANSLKDEDENTVGGRNRQRVYSLILHPGYVWNSKFLGAYPGVEVLIPFAHIQNSFSVPGSGSDSGPGDLTVAPFLQWSPPNFTKGAVSVRVALQISAPTGDYHASDAVDTGHGSWQLSPYVATTWRITDRWELSGRLIDDWSGVVDGMDANATPARLRAGNFLVLNASMSYPLAPQLRAGVGGYMLRQISPSTSNGQNVPQSLQSVNALGPVTLWNFRRCNLLFAAYREFGAKNRPEGVSANVRFQLFL